MSLYLYKSKSVSKVISSLKVRLELDKQYDTLNEYLNKHKFKKFEEKLISLKLAKWENICQNRVLELNEELSKEYKLLMLKYYLMHETINEIFKPVISKVLYHEGKPIISNEFNVCFNKLYEVNYFFPEKNLQPMEEIEQYFNTNFTDLQLYKDLIYYKSKSIFLNDSNLKNTFSYKDLNNLKQIKSGNKDSNIYNWIIIENLSKNQDSVNFYQFINENNLELNTFKYRFNLDKFKLTHFSLDQSQYNENINFNVLKRIILLKDIKIENSIINSICRNGNSNDKYYSNLMKLSNYLNERQYNLILNFTDSLLQPFSDQHFCSNFDNHYYNSLKFYQIIAYFKTKENKEFVKILNSMNFNDYNIYDKRIFKHFFKILFNDFYTGNRSFESFYSDYSKNYEFYDFSVK